MENLECFIIFIFDKISQHDAILYDILYIDMGDINLQF